MRTNNFDYIIIGQGLAGTILAMQLIEHGQRVLVVDNNHSLSASKVAAGIINPITGPRLSLDKGFDSFYTVAQHFFSRLEKKLNISVWQDLSQQRLIKDSNQFEYYQKRLDDPIYQSYLGTKLRSEYFDSTAHVINIKKSAVIDCKTLLETSRRYLQENNSLSTCKIDYADIVATDNGFMLDGHFGNRLIFCEGHQATHNPWLKSLPFVLSKGEILTVETDQDFQGLLNWGNWLINTGSEIKLGSNYEHNDLNDSTNEVTKIKLLDGLRDNTKLKAHSIKHESGIRPTTKHRTPFVGSLSNLNNAYCFNGFGSKGCLLIPYYAELLSHSLSRNEIIPKELTRWL